MMSPQLRLLGFLALKTLWSLVSAPCVCGGGAARVSFWHPCSGSGQLQIHTSWGGSGEGLRGLTYAGEICRGPQAAVPTH